MLTEATVTDKQREQIEEVASRMLSGEEGLHSKQIGDVKLVRKDTLPKLLQATLKADLYYGRLAYVGSLKDNGHEISIYERRHHGK